jgi:hypothetical protein
MRSREEVKRPDLKTVIRTTQEDTEARRRLRYPKLDFESYLEFLEFLGDEDPSILV